MNRTLRQLCERDVFRRASGRFNCMLQYHFTATCFALLCDQASLLEYTTWFPSPDKWRQFLACGEVVSFLLSAAIRQTPSNISDSDDIRWQWKTVRGYALLITQFLTTPPGGEAGKNPDLDYVGRAASLFVSKGGVHMIVQLIRANVLNIVETNYSVSLLKHVWDHADGVLEDSLLAGGLGCLARLFSSGALDRKLEQMEIVGVSEHEQVFLALPIAELEMVSVSTLNAVTRIKRAKRHVGSIRQIAGELVARLIGFSDLSRQHALCIPGPSSCLKSSIACLRKPYSPDYGMGRGVVRSASNILFQILSNSHDLVHEFLQGADFEPLLRKWLFAPYRWPIYDLLAIIRKVLEKREPDCPCFQSISSLMPILEACALYVFSANGDIQENAHYILVELCQHSKSCLRHLTSLDLLSPKLYSGKVVPLLEQGVYGTGDVPEREFPVPDDPEWLKKDEQFEDVYETLASPLEYNAEKLRQQGEDEYCKSNYAEAINYYTAAFLVPGRYGLRSVTTSTMRAEAYFAQKRYDKAVQDATRAIAFDFDDRYSTDVAKALYVRASAFCFLGRIFEAYNDVQRSVFEMPNEDKYRLFYEEVKASWQRRCERDNEKLIAASKVSVKCTRCHEERPSMPRCARCRVPYCSFRCQRVHWLTHRKECTPSHRLQKH